jgi:hypothetical protein
MISLEYGHIYTDELPCAHHFESVKAHLLLEGPFQKVIMIDDYHPEPENVILDTFDYIQRQAPDAWVMESRLASYVPAVLATVASPRERRGQQRWHDKTGLWSCSALTAVWYSLRLGLVPDPLRLVRGRLGDARILVNALPEAFEEQEARTMKVMGQERHRIWTYSYNPGKLATR